MQAHLHVTVWACVGKKRYWLNEEMYGVWSKGFLSHTNRETKEDLERGCGKDCQACKLNKEDAIDRSRWRKLIKDVWWSGWVWVGECFFWYRHTWVVSDKEPLNSRVSTCDASIPSARLRWHRCFVQSIVRGLLCYFRRCIPHHPTWHRPRPGPGRVSQAHDLNNQHQYQYHHQHHHIYSPFSK